MKTMRPLAPASLLLTLLAMTLLTTAALATPDTLVRDEIADEYKWDLGDIYPDWEAWEKDLARVEVLMEEFKALQGTLADGPQQILKANLMSDELGKIAAKVSRYAGLQSVTDMANNDIAARSQQVGILFSQFGTAMAWFNPEMLEIPWETMQKWLSDTP